MEVGGDWEKKVVVIIQDASREVSWSAIKWAICSGLSLKGGDELTLVGVVHQANNPSTSSFIGAAKWLGYKSKVDSSSMFGTNHKLVEEQVARKKEEYTNNEEMLQLLNLCQTQQIKFQIEVKAGPSPKVVALQVAQKLKTTWVILDRQMKKDKQYFLERLSCGISRMKRNNTIEQLRGPIGIISDNKKLGAAAAARKSTSSTTSSHSHVIIYNEMIPGSPDQELAISPNKSPQKMIISLGKEQGGNESGGPPLPNPSHSLGNTRVSSSSSCIREEEDNTATKKPDEQETGGGSLFSIIPDGQERDQTQTETCNTFNTAEGGSPNELVDGNQQHVIGDLRMEGYEVVQLLFENVDDNNSMCSVCKNRRPKGGWTKDFTYAELHAATEGFSPNNFLSEGGFGSVYRGKLINGLTIAVKQHKHVSFQGEKEFKSEVDVLSKARHKNLVMLLGSCSQGSHRLLVYEYVCNGSLDQHLSKHTRRALNWDERIKIAVGAAKGLEYLHSNKIIHRDVRPNNILVTHDHESLLGDFGLARSQYEDSNESASKVVGTLGYLAPEYAESGKASSKTDVYSFGVVLLQLITGLSTTDIINGGKSLIGWARPLLKEKNYPDLIDPRIVDSHDMHQLFWMVIVAEKCLSKDPRKRCTMASVVNALDYIIEGNASSIRDFSPAHESDSISSTDGSQGGGNGNGNAGTKEDEESLVVVVGTQSSSIPTTSGKKSSREETREELCLNTTRLLYNEMII